MDKKLRDSLRNELVNTFGLSRESIRQEAEAFIERVIQKHAESLLSDNRLKDVVSHEIEKVLRNPVDRGGTSFRSLIQLEIKKQIAELVVNNIKIGVSIKGHNPKSDESPAHTYVMLSSE